MKFPKHLKHKGRTLVTIYGKPPGGGFYRVYWRTLGVKLRKVGGKLVDGKLVGYKLEEDPSGPKPLSRFKDHRTYSEAKKHADELLKDLSKGKAMPLSPGQVSDAVAALERLHAFHVATGRTVSLLGAVCEFTDAAAKLDGRPLGGVVDGYLTTVATVKRKDVLEAVTELIKARKAKTVPRKEGKRPALSPEHHYNTALFLTKFAETFPGHAVSDLTKQHIALYMGKYAGLSVKTRNELRGLVKMFLKWAVEHDYLSKSHRLFEASELAHEPPEGGEIECYSAEDLKGMLDRASRTPKPAKKDEEAEADYRPLVPLIALVGLGGLRLAEALRLTFEEVFHRPDHIELKAGKSKTRTRRLAEVCPALAAWLEPYRDKTGPVWKLGYDQVHWHLARLRSELEPAIPNKRNGLRHSFISAHFAAYQDENKTGMVAGTSPAMIHQHYKGLLTKEEGEAWFNVMPQRPDNVIQLGATKKKA